MHPYGDNAEHYWSAGWRGILPLPPNRKEPPPYGYTGANGEWPSFADVFAWAEENPSANIALRLPSNVLGIDVDCYSGKVGRRTLDNAISRWGPLPLTWVSTSRDDGVSGIYLFRVPDDLRWPGEVGPAIELIQRRHRYMVAPPSVHPSGKPYGWIDPDGYPREQHPPNIDELPWLPDSWVHGLTLGELAHDVSKVWVTNEQVAAWIGAAPSGPLCGQVKAAVVATTGRLRESQRSRHETATRGVMRLAHLGSEGHHGAAEALGIVHGVFMAVATLGAGARAPETAGAEWERIVYGAIGVVMPQGFDEYDPCTNPLGVKPPSVSGIPSTIAAPNTELLSGEVDNVKVRSATNGAVDIDIELAHDSAPQEIVDKEIDGKRDGQQEAKEGRKEFNPVPDEIPMVPSGGGHKVINEPLHDGSTDSTAHDSFSVPSAENNNADGGSDDNNVNPHDDLHEQTLADNPELAFMLEQQLLRQRASQMAREILEREKAAATFRVPPSLRTLTDELAVPDEEALWTISEVLPEGANVLLTAQYKTGKTTLVNHTAKALSDGVDFLGRFLVYPTTHVVALWNYEVSAGMYRRWLRDLLIKNADSISLLNLRGYSLPLLVPTVQDFAVEWLISRRVNTWVVDPAARAMPGMDENSNVEVGQFLDMLDTIKKRAGVQNLILVTHTGRAEMAIGKERARGATRFDDWADVRWLLTKDDDGHRYFRATGRDVETDEYRLWFEPLTRGLTASDDGRPPKPTGNPTKVTDGAIADAIVRAVRDVPGQTLRTIEQNVRANMKCRATRVYDMVKALESQGVIVGIEGARGSRHIYPPDVARALSDRFPTASPTASRPETS